MYPIPRLITSYKGKAHSVISRNFLGFSNFWRNRLKRRCGCGHFVRENIRLMFDEKYGMSCNWLQNFIPESSEVALTPLFIDAVSYLKVVKCPHEIGEQWVKLCTRSTELKCKLVFMDRGTQTRKSGADVARAGNFRITGRKQQGRVNIPRYSGALRLRYLISWSTAKFLHRNGF